MLLIVACVITLILAGGILRTSFDTSLNALLTRSDPYLDEYDLLDQEFPGDVEVTFAFISSQSN